MARFGMPDVVARLQRALKARGCRLLAIAGRPASLACWLLCLILVGPAAGQAKKRHFSKTGSLAQAVPASAGLFIELNKIASDESSARARNAYHLYQLLIDPPDSRQGNTDWRSMVLSSLGLDPGEDVRDLFSHRLAIAAPSWKKLAEGIIVVRLSRGDNLINEVFAPDDVGTIDGKGDVTVYRTHTLLSAATNGDLLVISQRNYSGSLYDRMVKHMLHGSGPVLADDPGFQTQIRDLPAQRDGTVYVNFSTANANSGAANLFSMGLTRLAIGIYFKADHVDFAFRATRARARDGQPRATVSVRRLRQLPLTTLAAWCTEFNVRRAFGTLIDKQIDDNTPAYLKLLVQILDVEKFERELIDNLGPGAIVTWDQHLGPGPEIPQIALLLESGDASQCSETFADAVQVVVDWFDIKNRGKPGRRLSLTRTDYLGTTIYEVSLPAKPLPSTSRRAPNASISPAFAAVGDSFVIALSADHIRNIIDAHWGLAPRLASLRNLAVMDHGRNPAVLLGVAQPMLAAQIVDHWLNDSQGPMMRWFAQALGSRPSNARRQGYTPRLGIGTQSRERPGMVRVARVDRTGPSFGHLLPGDHILGLNGSLLSLVEPIDDLRRLVTETASTIATWVLRIEREGQYLDVVVPTTAPGRAVPAPSAALRQLQNMLQRVDFGSIRAIETAPNRVSADLTLRFSAGQSRG